MTLGIRSLQEGTMTEEVKGIYFLCNLCFKSAYRYDANQLNYIVLWRKENAFVSVGLASSVIYPGM